MESLLCIGSIILIVSLLLFFYLLNTARKKTPVPHVGKKEYTPVYVSIADQADTVMQGMDKFVTEVQKTESAGDKWRWIPLTIFFVGLGLMAVDLLLVLLGYTSFVFISGGVLLWIAALIMARNLRKSDSHDFSPRYKDTKEILYTLSDDLKPASSFLGHLDLTGAMLKAKLYDGNILRVSAIQRSKQRQPYWKRSRISGKMKQKPAKFKGSEQQLKVRIAVNPEVYKIVSNKEFRQGANIGKYTIMQLNTEGSIIDVVASSPFEEVESEHILSFLHSAYSLLQRKAA